MRGAEVRPDSVLSERCKIAYKTINAGAKTVATTASFREAWRARR
jgi:putative SOS response-associated peptidase YedK